MADQYTEGSADQYTEGPADQYTEGSADQYTEGPADQYTEGSADQYTEGSADQYTEGPADQYTEGPADQYTEGSADQYTEGPADQHNTRRATMGFLNRGKPTALKSLWSLSPLRSPSLLLHLQGDLRDSTTDQPALPRPQRNYQRNPFTTRIQGADHMQE
ncbi:unnamed protein product [Arctogadus glacialis]